MDVSALLNTTSSTATASGSKAARDAQENQDRFLTLLVAQMKNQDPMNPMENAQLTTQIAQIQTVTGIDQLNTAIDKLGTQYGQGQAMSAVGLVGRTVNLAGNRLLMGSNGAQGAFELSGAADRVEVEITTAAGTVIDTVDLGAASAGRHVFNWTQEGYKADLPLQFKVKATRGATTVPATTYARDQVVAVNTAGGTVQFELASGKRSDFASLVSVD